MNTEKDKCFLCGKNRHTDLHHVFNGALRDKSTKYGLWVFLCRECHTGRNGVHNNATKMRNLKALVQAKAMETYGWDMSEWRKLFYKNYL